MTEYNINSQWTLLERAKRSVDGKTVLPILDVMDKVGVQDFLKDVPFFQANQGLRHRIVRTTSRPSSTRRTFYKGVGTNITTTQVIYEPVILFEQRSEIDEDELDTVANPNEARRQEDMGHIKGLQEDIVTAMFTDARTSGSEYIDGFAQRLANLRYPGGSSESLPYCWDNGGSAATGSLCSLWIVEYGPQAVHGLFPGAGAVRGGALGVDARNKGKEPKLDSDDTTLTFYVYVTQFKQWMGLAIHNDWKIARIANINRDVTGTGALDENVVIDALEHGKFDPRATRIYCNAWVKSQMRVKTKDKLNVEVRDVFGKAVDTINGIPIRVLDTTILPATESAIAA